MTLLSGINSSAPLLIVHPNFKYKSLFLSELDAAGWLNVYHRFSKEVKDSRLLAHELAPLRDRGCLILDDADLVDPDILSDMLEKLLPHNFIVLFVQDFPDFIKTNQTIRELAQVFPADDAMMPDYLNLNGMVLEVSLLDNAPIRSNGKRKNLGDKNVNGKNAGASKAIDTLIYMLLNKYASKQSIQQDFKNSDGEHIFSIGTIHNHINAINTLADDIKIIVSENGGFKTNDDIEFRTNVFEFQKSVEKVLKNTQDWEAIDQAISFYRHCLLPESDATWSIELRHKLQEYYITCLKYKANLLVDKADIVTATTMAFKAFRLNNMRGDLAYLVMVLFYQQNEIEKVVEIYEQHVSAWESSGQTYYPSQRILDLLAKMKK